jgi:hypothetical protein
LAASWRTTSDAAAVLLVAGVLFFISSLGSAWPESWLGHLGSVLTPLINALIWFLNLFFEDAPYVHFGDLITNFIGHRLFGGYGHRPGLDARADVHRRDCAALQARRAGHLSANRDRQRYHRCRTS